MKFGISNLAPISEVVGYWLSWEGMECSWVMSALDFVGHWYSCFCRVIFFSPIVTGLTEIITIIATFAATGKEIAAVLLAKA